MNNIKEDTEAWIKTSIENKLTLEDVRNITKYVIECIDTSKIPLLSFLELRCWVIECSSGVELELNQRLIKGLHKQMKLGFSLNFWTTSYFEIIAYCLEGYINENQ